jgi:hypothetical protein
MDDYERGRIVAEARNNIAAGRELERDAADRRLEADMLRLRRQYRETKPMLHRDAPSIIHKVKENALVDAPAPAPAPLPSPAELNAILGQCFNIETKRMGETLRAEQMAELSDLRNQVAELRGRLDVVLSLLSGSKAADVVQLPRRA